MFKIYTGEMLAARCNNRKFEFSLLTWARKAPDQFFFIFSDIWCVVTLYNFPRISRQLK